MGGGVRVLTQYLSDIHCSKGVIQVARSVPCITYVYVCGHSLEYNCYQCVVG